MSPKTDVEAMINIVSSFLDVNANDKNWPLKKRLAWLKTLDKLIVLNKDAILEVVAGDKRQSEHNVLLTEYAVVRLLIKEYRKRAKKVLRDENRSRFFSASQGNKKVVIQKRPLGIVGVISPYNYPFSLPMGTIISAILAGNGVVLKPAEETPTTNDMINYLIAMSLRSYGVSGIFQILPPTVEHGKALVNCEKIDKIHFTGSVQAGWSVIKENANKRFVSPTLELGGSNPAIVLEDANIKQTAKIITWARFANMSCNNIKRVFAVKSIYDQLCQAVETEVGNIQEHEICHIPEKEIPNYRNFLKDYLANYPEMEMDDIMRPRVLRISNSKKRNLKVLIGETFVPLLPIVKVENEKEAVYLANQTQFGLGASIFTDSKSRFKKLASELQCGGVFHNDGMTEFAQPQVPFGGWKQSGFGYSHGPEGLLEFVRLKTVIMERWRVPKFHLFPWTDRVMRILRKTIDWLIKFS